MHKIPFPHEEEDIDSVFDEYVGKHRAPDPVPPKPKRR